MSNSHPNRADDVTQQLSVDPTFPTAEDHTQQFETTQDTTQRFETTQSVDTGGATTPPTEEARTEQAPALLSPVYKSGPTIWPILVGLVGLVATLVGWSVVQTTVVINWGIALPALVVAVGALIIVVGLAGLRRQRQEP